MVRERPGWRPRAPFLASCGCCATGGFLGTGLLIAPDRVLTCRHVVAESDGRGGWSEVARPHLQVQRADGTSVAVKPPPNFPSQWDLALLALEGTLPAPVPPLLWGLTETLEPILCSAPIWVYGYSKVEANTLWQHPINVLLRLPSSRNFRITFPIGTPWAG